MRLAREFPKLEDSKAQRVADLPLREAMQALAVPKETSPNDQEITWEDAFSVCRKSAVVEGWAGRLADSDISKTTKLRVYANAMGSGAVAHYIMGVHAAINESFSVVTPFIASELLRDAKLVKATCELGEAIPDALYGNRRNPC